MRKLLLVLVSILLIAGTVQAAEMTQAMTAEYTAQPKGRSVTSDSSVIVRIWYTGTSSSAGVGVSNTSAILLYSDVPAGTATTISSGTDATIGAVVDRINNTAGWHATVGDDSYRAMISTALLPENIAAPGDREDNGYTVNLDCSTATFMSCGVYNSIGKIGRIKSYYTNLTSTANVPLTLDIYEGDTSVYHRYLPDTAYGSTTAAGSSLSTVTFADKGLAGSKNTPLCVVIDTSGTLATSATAKAQNVVSIVYDKLSD